ncbi:MAG: UGMP family protein [Candidatus Altiarchaeales archaeon HGW-Altiarchaeales-3]|nr:MAG: UGMP family protein [Candidatus Altiarchaeales archaeon HGW-Altiarchaeales-3]
MITLGIEGTAHTIGIGITDDSGNILADARRTYKPAKGQGIVPRDAVQFIGDNMRKTIDDALSEANLDFNEIDLIAFSQGPGLGPCLRTAATAARVLALYHKIPIMGVNHCVAHIEIGKLICKFSDPLILYVSGGNTQVLKLKDRRYRIFGETLDIGIGNMLDKFGRAAGLSHPAGPKIEELAAYGKNYIELPYVVKGTDLSFSGVLTSAISKLHNLEISRSSKFKEFWDNENLRFSLAKAKPIQKFNKNFVPEDICFSLQETAFSMLTEVTERALAHLKSNEVLLAGGVGNNTRLSGMLKTMAKEHNCVFGVPKKYCSDNGVMIAWLGNLMYNSGVRCELADTAVKQGFRTDEVEVLW